MHDGKERRKTNWNFTFEFLNFEKVNRTYGVDLGPTNFILHVPITINPEKSLLWDLDLGPASPSGT